MAKGQLSIYIFLGILLLAVIGLSTYLVTVYVFNPVHTSDTAIQDYVESCIDRVSTRAVQKLGEHGGYIDPTDARLTDRELALVGTPAEGDALPRLENLYIPYWWYMPTPNDCTTCAVEQHIPTIAQMERQLEHYINTQISMCTNAFAPFHAQGYTIHESTPESNVGITQNGVHITVNWPLTIQSANNRYIRINEFNTRIDVPLQDMWQSAQDIVRQLSDEQPIENTIMHLVSSFSAPDYGRLPPIAAITHDPALVTWQKPLVQHQLRQIFNTYFSTLQIAQARDAQRIIVGEDKSVEQGVYDALYLDLLNYQLPYQVQFEYLDWPFYFDITPTDDGTLRPEVHQTRFPQDVAPPFQTNYYEFFYDLSLPYLVTLHDTNALKGTGYTFSFAAEANIRDNKNLQEWHAGDGTVGPWDESRYTLTQQLPRHESGTCTCTANGVPTTEISQCFDKAATCNLDGTTYQNYTDCASNCRRTIAGTTEEAIPAKSLFCDDTFHTKGIADIRVRDAQTDRPLPGADVHYGCGSFATCSIGESDQRGSVYDTLPFCHNGFLKTYHPGYYTDTQLHTSTDETTLIEVNLTPTKEVSIKVNVYEMYNSSNRTQVRMSSLAPTEQIVLSIEKQLDEAYHTPLTIFTTISSRSQPSITLIPGTYTLNAQLIDESGYLLPRQCKRIDVPDQAPRFVPDEDLILRPGIRGGAVLSGENGSFDISPSLYNSSQLTISVLRQPKPTCIQSHGCILQNCIGLEELDKTVAFSLLHRDILLPQLD